MKADFRVCILLSGRGSNLESLINKAQHYNITHVFSNKPKARGLEVACSNKIQARGFRRKDYSSVSEQKKAIYSEVQSVNPDLIALAGYMQILEADFVDRYYGKIVNIHPSLLPLYPGLDTHERALQDEVQEHGCTVHFVDSGVDTGPIIAQAKVAVESQHTSETLAKKILIQEHLLYPTVLNLIAQGDISLSEAGVQFTNTGQEIITNSGFFLPES